MLLLMSRRLHQLLKPPLLHLMNKLWKVLITRRSPARAHPDDPDVVITRAEFVEPGRPTVLARCSAKEELLERRRARLDITDYANLSIGDILSGYVNQVHNSRDLEIDMVKQIQQKSEV